MFVIFLLQNGSNKNYSHFNKSFSKFHISFQVLGVNPGVLMRMTMM